MYNVSNEGSQVKNPRSLSKALAMQSITQFGPGCRPMFYTALLNQPEWLGWCPISNVDECTVYLEDAEIGLLVWSATALDNSGFQWQVPELSLTRSRAYQWRVEPSHKKLSDAGSIEACTNAFPTLPVTDRIARFWLISSDELARFTAGLAMLRERADPAFLAIAEALYLAEFQMYHHALSRLPVGRGKGSLALPALVASARSVIFRQMMQHIVRANAMPPCFAEWAELNEQYYRNQTEARLYDGDQHNNVPELRGEARRHKTKRASPITKLRQTLI